MLASTPVSSENGSSFLPSFGSFSKGRFYEILENNMVIDAINYITPKDGFADFGEFLSISLKGWTHYTPQTNFSGAQPVIDYMLALTFASKLPSDLLYFIRPESLPNAENPESSFAEHYREGKYYAIASRIVLVAVDVAAIFDLLGTANIVDLGKLANNIGNRSVYGYKVLGFVAQLSLDNSFQYKLLAFNVLCLANTLRDNKNYENGTLNEKSKVRVIKNGCEIAFRTYLIFFGFSLGHTHIILGVLAKGTGVLAGIYDELGKAKEARLKIKPAVPPATT